MLLGIILTVSVLAAAVICGCCGGFAGLAWLWLLPVGFLGSFLVLVIAAFLFLWAACALVDMSKPQEHDSPFYRKMAAVYIDAVKKVIRLRVHTRGLENTPKDGRFMLVCNHLSNADPVLLLAYFKNSQLAFISKRENADMFLIGKIMHRLMCQMINRENDREALKTIIKCIQLLKDDEVSIGAFPEGYCSLDGRLQHFRSGIFKVAQKANVPIVVCTIKNTVEIFDNLPKLKPTDVDLHLVGIIPAEELKGVNTVEIADRVFHMMLEDLGPEFAPLDAENT